LDSLRFVAARWFTRGYYTAPRTFLRAPHHVPHCPAWFIYGLRAAGSGLPRARSHTARYLYLWLYLLPVPVAIHPCLVGFTLHYSCLPAWLPLPRFTRLRYWFSSSYAALYTFPLAVYTHAPLPWFAVYGCHATLPGSFSHWFCCPLFHTGLHTLWFTLLHTVLHTYMVALCTVYPSIAGSLHAHLLYIPLFSSLQLRFFTLYFATTAVAIPHWFTFWFCLTAAAAHFALRVACFWFCHGSVASRYLLCRPRCPVPLVLGCRLPFGRTFAPLWLPRSGYAIRTLGSLPLPRHIRCRLPFIHCTRLPSAGFTGSRALPFFHMLAPLPSPLPLSPRTGSDAATRMVAYAYL